MSQAKGYQSVVFTQSTAVQHLVLPILGGGRAYRIRGVVLTAPSTVVATLESNSTALLPLNVVTPVVLPPTGGAVGEHWAKCEPDEAFNITLDAAVQVDGVIYYDIIEA